MTPALSSLTWFTGLLLAELKPKRVQLDRRRGRRHNVVHAAFDVLILVLVWCPRVP